MKQETKENALLVLGALLIVTGAFLLHPGLGLAVIGWMILS